MKIFCTYSSDAEVRGAYEECIKKAGHEIVKEDARALLGADALFICICGKENRRVKEDLNLALDKGLPVAFVREEGGEPDTGLKMQLSIAADIQEDDDGTKLAEWLRNTATAAVVKKKNKTAKKMIIFAAAFVLMAAGIIITVIATGNSKDVTTESALTKEQELGIDVAALKNSSKIDLSGKGIEDITFLSECTDCTELDISNNSIVDISILSKVPELRILNVSGNKIEDINVLLTLKNLKEADISNNPIGDYTSTTFLNGVYLIQ